MQEELTGLFFFRLALLLLAEVLFEEGKYLQKEIQLQLSCNLIWILLPEDFVLFPELIFLLFVIVHTSLKPGEGDFLPRLFVH